MSKVSVEEIVAEAERTIAHMHRRPTMYVSSTNDVCAAAVIDGMFWSTHWLWAHAGSCVDTLRRSHQTVRELHSCGSTGFVDAFRSKNPEASAAATFEYVLSCWAEIDDLLGIDITEPRLD